MKLSIIKALSEYEGSHYHDSDIGVTVHDDSHLLHQDQDQGERQEL